MVYTPTTPVLSSISVSYDPKECSAASTACERMSYSRSQCLLTGKTSDTSAYSSCLCDPAILSLEYSCRVLGNVSCLQVPAHLDQMTGYSYCDNINEVLTVPESLVSFHHSQDNSISSTSVDICPQTASLGTGTTNRAPYFTAPTTTASQAGTTFPSSPAETNPAASNGARFVGVDRSQTLKTLLILAIACPWLVLAL